MTVQDADPPQAMAGQISQLQQELQQAKGEIQSLRGDIQQTFEQIKAILHLPVPIQILLPVSSTLNQIGPLTFDGDQEESVSFFYKCTICIQECGGHVCGD